MRLWTLHPRYLDATGLVSVWRKALLARQVLRGRTKGYRSHPQLQRFRDHPAPISAINAYLLAIHEEAAARGYAFDARKLGPVRDRTRIRATDGQLAYEWRHLRGKLLARCPERARRRGQLAAHPLFRVVKGPVEPWERRSPPRIAGGAVCGRQRGGAKNHRSRISSSRALGFSRGGV